MIRDSVVDALIREAETLRQTGRLDEALAAYERLLARAPDLPECWYNLALTQRQTGRFAPALQSYQQALDRGVSKPEEVHLNRGVIFSDCLRRPDAAENELKAALRLNPSYAPALLNLANLKEECGDREGASRLYERILVLEPNFTEALARYASLQQTCTPSDPLVPKLRAAIADPRTPAASRASLGFALGKTLDQSGAFDEAFEAYARANRHSRESARGAPVYNRSRQERFIDDLIKAFPLPRRELMPPPDGRSPPIFICGMFRSGSTLVEQVLASHRKVTPGGELDFIPTVVRSELAPFPARMGTVSVDELAAVADRYRRHLSQLFPGAERVTDKRPDNFLYIGLIKALLPDARIVNTVRDPLDNCLAVYFLHLDHGMPYALDLLDTAHYYRQYQRLMAHWKSLFGPDILDFDYDVFVREPRPALEKLLSFCGLEWEEACLSFHETKTVVKTESVWQVRTPLYQRSSGRWRNYEKFLPQVSAYLNDLPSAP